MDDERRCGTDAVKMTEVENREREESEVEWGWRSERRKLVPETWWSMSKRAISNCRL